MDKCVCCGADVPEGYGHICPKCAAEVETTREDSLLLYLLCRPNENEETDI